MTLFQKLKIKLFGKERWRVVGSAETGDRMVFPSGSVFQVTSVCGSVTGVKCLLERRGDNCGGSTIYRKVN